MSGTWRLCYLSTGDRASLDTTEDALYRVLAPGVVSGPKRSACEADPTHFSRRRRREHEAAAAGHVPEPSRTK
jgi:hypothetical protein